MNGMMKSEPFDLVVSRKAGMTAEKALFKSLSGTVFKEHQLMRLRYLDISCSSVVGIIERSFVSFFSSFFYIEYSLGIGREVRSISQQLSPHHRLRALPVLPPMVKHVDHDRRGLVIQLRNF